MQKPPETFTRKELADMLKCSVKTIVRREMTDARLKDARIPAMAYIRYNAAKIRVLFRLDQPRGAAPALRR